MKFYKNTELPKALKEDESESVKVIMSDEYGNLYIGFYCFVDKEWYFIHSDDFFDKDNFIWWYLPNGIAEQFKSTNKINEIWKSFRK
jgi:hypothetical protein